MAHALRTLLTLSLIVPLAGLVGSTEAHADTLTAPAPVTTADRDFGNGGPATLALVHAAALTTGSDGSTIFYDSASRQIRAVDAATGNMTVLAGNENVTASCSEDTTQVATAVGLPKVSGLWTDAAGDVFMWPGGLSNCFAWGDVYRLDHSDHMWHLAVKQLGTPCCSQWNGAYHAVAVDSTGDVFVSDTANSVIREFAPTADPTSTGVIVAGISGSPGTSGDGGLATAAQISNPDVLAAAPDGSVYLANYNGHRIRQIDATTGVISTVAGNGAGNLYPDLAADDGKLATSAAIDVNAITIGSDGTVYFTDMTNYGKAAERAFAVGGPVRTAVGPASPNSDGDPALCPGTAITTNGSTVLVACGSTVRSWPADGSAAQVRGTAVAGLADPAGQNSPDGAPLSDAFLGPVSNIVAAPDGSVAFATTAGIRRLSGLTANDTLDTLTSRHCGAMAFDAGGTLYCATGTGVDTDPYEIVSITASHTTTVIAGGGSSTLADGATGTAVNLTAMPELDIDRARQLLYFTSPSPARIWSLDLTTGAVRLFAGNTSGTGTISEGQSALSAPLNGLRDVAVDQSSHVVYASYGCCGVTTSVDRIDVDGTIHVLGCTVQCGFGDLRVGTDGTLYVSSFGRPVALHPSGASADDLPAISGPMSVLPDGRLISMSGQASGDAGGLLTTVTPPDDSFPADAATATASPGPASITVEVTPPAVSGEVVTITAAESPSAPLWPTGGRDLTSFVTNGSTTPRTFTFFHYADSGSPGPGFSSAHDYRVAVYTTAYSTTINPQLSATSAPVVQTVIPQPDTTAPGAPTALTASGNSTVNFGLTLPSDGDLSAVHVRWVAGDVPPGSPSTGVGPDYLVGWGVSPGQAVSGAAFSLDPNQDYTFAAWSEDTSGNLSDPVVVTRARAHLVAGAPVTGIGFQTQGNGTTEVMWTGGFAATIRYAAGTTIPATPADGQEASQVGSVWGQGAAIPVANGAEVAVAIFNYTADPANTFQRAGFVITGGTSSDTLALGGPTSVAAGTKPTLVATLTRKGPLAQTALAGVPVELFKRAAGAAIWTDVQGGYTTSNGTVSFSAPIETVTTAYLVRSVTVDPLPITGSRVVGVRSAVTAALSRSTVLHGVAVYVSGVFSPHAKVTVRLQRYYSSSWHTVSTLTTSTTGGYRFKYTPLSRGKYLFRVLFPGSAAYLTSASPTRQLTAT